ncbi:tail fiber assembly protein [Ewingella sp. S1.OA.A_B6]
MEYVFSAKTLAFYPTSMKEDYVKANSWPADGVDVPDGTYEIFFDVIPAGKMRGADKNGMPVWIDVPPLTQEEIMVLAKTDKESRMSEANSFMNNKQWPGKAAIGRLKGDDLAQYNLWLDYLDALDAIDPTAAPDIKWPASPEK